MTSSRKTSGPKKKSRKINVKKLFAWLFATAAFAVFCALAAYLFFILNGENLLNKNFNKLQMDEASIIYDADGNEVTRLYRQNRELVEFNEIPKRLIEAFIATEDRRFDEHAGIDPRAIGRALYKDILHRSAVEGGSTITQQLAKNMFLSSDKTLFRKASEAAIAIALENNYSKDEIIEMYLNQIYFGSGTYGVKAAAKRYFDKSDLSKLELWEMATLAGIPKAPSHFSPLLEPVRSNERRAVVLKLMYDQGYISLKEKNEAAAKPFKPIAESEDTQEYQTYLDYVVDEAEEVAQLSDEELRRGGYKIYTAIHAKAQTIMETTFANDEWFGKDGPKQKVQGSMVILNHKDGGIVAMIGGRDYASRGTNRVVERRQPGSSFKPIVAYAPAIETGKWNPYSNVSDVKRSFGKYSPNNYDGKYHGDVNMFQAVKYSYNLAAVWLLNEIGIDRGMEFAAELGIPLGDEDRNLSIALGGLTHGATPLQMARAYSAFANLGELHKEHAIIKILDADDQEIYAFVPEKKRVMSRQAAYYMTLLLQSVVEPNGTGQSAQMERPVAGKTGTTQVGIKGIKNGNRDAWFVGYTPEWTAAVWMGFDKTDKDHYLTLGSSNTSKIFKEVMSRALAGRKVTEFVKPEGVEDLTQPPAAITDLTAVYTPENSGIQLQWTPIKGEVTYRLYRKADMEEEFTGIQDTPTSNIRDFTVEKGRTYEYYVIAYLAASDLEGKASNKVSVIVPEDNGTLDPVDPSDPMDPMDPMDPLDPLNPILNPSENTDNVEVPGESHEDPNTNNDQGLDHSGGSNENPSEETAPKKKEQPLQGESDETNDGING